MKVREVLEQLKGFEYLVYCDYETIKYGNHPLTNEKGERCYLKIKTRHFAKDKTRELDSEMVRYYIEKEPCKIVSIDARTREESLKDGTQFVLYICVDKLAKNNKAKKGFILEKQLIPFNEEQLKNNKFYL